MAQNNVAMADQYNRIVEWKKEVEHVHHAHKDKILEARGRIDQVRDLLIFIFFVNG